jgi:Zn-dependent M28 family amino/carboxypeptidase
MGPEEQALAERLRSHVEQLAGTIGERNVFRPLALHAAASYVERQWEKQGYGVTQLPYEVSGVRCLNLEATRKGSAREHEILLIGAHYDTVRGSPGANDNASGVSALIEISSLFTSIAPAMTVRFVAFVNEEPPFFMSRKQGSMVYAKAARQRKDDIRLMASLETIGWYCSEPGSQSYPPLFNLIYPDRADFLGIVSNFRSRSDMRRLAAAFRANSDFPVETAATFPFIPGVSWSDHRSFWRHGYRAVMITDTAFYRYPHYHASSDTPEKLAYPELARVTAGLFAAFSELACKGAG